MTTINTIKEDVKPGNYQAPSLTTIFTPPSSCLEPPADPTIGVDNYIYWQFDPSAYEGDYTSCYPPNFRSAWQSGLDLYYSPGVCPQGYATGFKKTVGDETRALCCISGWTSHSFWSDYCFRTLSREIWAPGVSIRWKASDEFATATTTGADKLPTDIATPRTTTGLPEPTKESDSSGAGMSRTTKIGIGAGIPVALLILGLAFTLFWIKRREERRARHDHSSADVPPAYTPVDKKPIASPTVTPFVAAPPNNGYYAPPAPQAMELDGSRIQPAPSPSQQPYYVPPGNSHSPSPVPYPQYPQQQNYPGSPVSTLVASPPTQPMRYHGGAANEPQMLDSTPVEPKSK